jgi:hypothetical protein
MSQTTANQDIGEQEPERGVWWAGTPEQERRFCLLFPCSCLLLFSNFQKLPT